MPAEAAQFLLGLGIPQPRRPIEVPLVSTCLPSGEKATLVIPSVCPTNGLTNWPVWASHSRAMRSRPPASTYLPSGEKTAAHMTLVLPSN